MKVNVPKSVAEYKPIVLYNVYYKILSKILMQRLQPVLDSIIVENQSAFIRSRAISDNIMTTHETLHYLKRSGATKLPLDIVSHPRLWSSKLFQVVNRRIPRPST